MRMGEGKEVERETQQERREKRREGKREREAGNEKCWRMRKRERVEAGRLLSTVCLILVLDEVSSRGKKAGGFASHGVLVTEEYRVG